MMFPSQNPTVPTPADAPPEATDPGLLASLGWIDRTALVVIGVFFVVGLFRGAGWQLGRIAMLAVAWLAAVIAGPELLQLANSQGILTATDPAVGLYVAGAVAFVVALVLLALIVRVSTRQRQELPLAVGSRLSGAGLGLVTGTLVALALLAAVQSFHRLTDWGSGIVHAAGDSRASAVGRGVFSYGQEVLPSRYQESAAAWEALFEPVPVGPGGGRSEAAPDAAAGDGAEPASGRDAGDAGDGEDAGRSGRDG